MLVRCERCRAVYELESVSAGVPVACSGCGHVFVAHAIDRFALGGAVGGAAARRRPAEKWDPQKAIRDGVARRRRRWSKRALLLGAAAMVGCAAAMALWFVDRTQLPPPEPPDEALNEVFAKAAADDAVSLEAARARVSRLLRVRPGDRRLLAGSAFVTALSASALATEANDIEYELARLTAGAPQEGPCVSERRAAFERLDDLAARLPEARQRARSLLQLAEEQAARALERGSSPTALRARAIVQAAKGERAPLLVTVSQLQKDDPWAAYASSIVGILDAKEASSSPLPSTTEGAQRKWIRLRFAAARASIVAKGGAPDAAEMAEVLRDSPRHEGALRWVEWSGR